MTVYIIFLQSVSEKRSFPVSLSLSLSYLIHIYFYSYFKQRVTVYQIVKICIKIACTYAWIYFTSKYAKDIRVSQWRDS